MTGRGALALLALTAASAPLPAKGGASGAMFDARQVELFGPRVAGGNFLGFVHLAGRSGTPRSGTAEVVIAAADGRALATGNHGFALDFNHPTKEIIFPVEAVNNAGGCAPPLGSTVDIQLNSGGRIERHSVPLVIRPNPTDGAPGHCTTPLAAGR